MLTSRCFQRVLIANRLSVTSTLRNQLSGSTCTVYYTSTDSTVQAVDYYSIYWHSTCRLWCSSVTRAKMEKSWPKVIVFGDSLTQFGYSKTGCWTALIADHLQRKCDVINRGFSGYNTRWCKIILPKLLTVNDAADIQMVTILLGANDSVDSLLCKKQHVPIAEFKQNMKDIVKYLLDIGITAEKIVIISPPACDEEKWKSDCKRNDRIFGKFNMPTAAYAKACIEVAEEMGNPSVDLYTAMLNEKHWEDMLSDGLHLSTVGSEFLFELLQPSIDKLTSRLGEQFPYWADIDNNDPHTLLDNY